ncbi:MAG: carboxypeptidase regulatory-like domain-containing protein [Anaerolineae bacterium]
MRPRGTVSGSRGAALGLIPALVALGLGLTLRPGPALAAPPRCLEEADWRVCYEATASDGLRIFNVTYGGREVLSSATIPQIDVEYAGFTLLDELGSLAVPAVGGTNAGALQDGFDLRQLYMMSAWPRCGTYRYMQSWRFHDDGRLEPRLEISGPGIEGAHTYDVYWRLDLDIDGPGDDSFQNWATGWSEPEAEGLFAAGLPLSPDGFKWRSVDGPRLYAVAPRPEDGAVLWALSFEAGQGDFNLPAFRVPNFPSQWVNGEGIQDTNVVLWYKAAAYKATNCDLTSQLVAGPVLSPIGFGAAPGPAATATAAPASYPGPGATETLAAGESPTPTVGPDSADIAGTLRLQGRSDHSGAQVLVDRAPAATSESDGSFRVTGLPPGRYQLRVQVPGYLCVEGQIEAARGRLAQLPPVEVPGGDVNDDGSVDILDLTAVAAAYGTRVTGAGAGDINADGVVDMFDLVMLAGNYGRQCPIPWVR